MTGKDEVAPEGFPYPVVWVDGANAFEEWRALATQERGTPVIVGGGEDLGRHAEAMAFAVQFAKAGSFDALRAHWLEQAHALKHPEALEAERAEESARAHAFFRQSPEDVASRESVQNQLTQLGFGAGEPDEEEIFDADDPELGDWPDDPYIMEGPSPAYDFDTASHEYRPRHKVAIVLLPTQDWTEAPAYLAFGGWNANPAAPLHVAALRAWRTRYGATLVSLTGDALELVVTRKPAARQEAIDLALEQHLYCEDNILQGEGEVAPRAAALMASDWWQFWWD